jgi:D-hydroxyproline dehydrogenase subunit beta
MSSFDVVIAGGGIVGAACAMEAAQSGLKTALVEANVIGGGVTAAGMGHIVVMDDSEEQFALTHYSRQLWDERAPQLPANVEYQRTGTIWVAADDEEMAAVRAKHEYYGQRGVRTEVLDAQSLETAEPNLRKGLAGGLLVPDDGVVYPPCAALYFAAQAKKAGAQIMIGPRVNGISDKSAVLSDRSTLSAPVIVNATGSWSPALTPSIEVKKRKGHLVITDRYPNFVRHQLVELGYLKSAHSVSSDSVAFNVQPRATGQLLIGSSRQYGDEVSDVRDEMLSRMLQRAVEFMPGLSKLSSIRAWTGFRPATPDKLPLIGPLDEPAGLHLATGHEGLGITTSLATAKLLVDGILGRSSVIDRSPFLPSRAMTAGLHG